ncbi:hypothetical protein [Spirillospora sp. NPDC048824]|uniref:hypothetical protein n=1 Tax=Spirillospora sp. NPDC048824 TaxID=3364526 RepID=UPI00371996A1
MTYLKTACDHGALDKTPPDQRLSARLRRFLLDGRDRERAIHRPDGFSFSTPAEGDGYDFSVNVQFTWCSTGVASAEELVTRAKEGYPALRDKLLDGIRLASRKFPPYEAWKAETEIARLVTNVFTKTRFEYVTADGPDGRVRPIEARTTVKPDETVRKAQQAAWNLRLAAENDHALAERLVPLLTRRRELWQAFLESGQGRWTTPYAANLAEKPQHVGETVQAMFSDRRKQAKELSEQINEQTEDYGELNAYELMIRNDTVLRRLMDLMGIDHAPEPATGPFGSSERNTWNGEGRP